MRFSIRNGREDTISKNKLNNMQFLNENNKIYSYYIKNIYLIFLSLFSASL